VREETVVPKYFSIRPAWTLRGRKFFGIRGWSGKPLHPPLTDFPIVCYALAALFDLVSRIRGGSDAAVAHDFFIAATLVIVVGFVVSLATALTGLWDWWKGIPRRKGGPWFGRARRSQVWRTANWHMTIMLTVTAIVIVDVAVRLAQLNDGRSSVAVTILSVIAAGLVLFGAGYGGEMVFDYQFNVEGMKDSTVWDETEVDQFPGRKVVPPQPPANAG
jgi:uncharacterized membrane protein